MEFHISGPCLACQAPSVDCVLSEACTHAWSVSIPKEGLSCAICTDDIHVGQEATQLERCAHIYHTDCLRQWKDSTSGGGAGAICCPLCRSVVFTPPDALPGFALGGLRDIPAMTLRPMPGTRGFDDPLHRTFRTLDGNALDTELYEQEVFAPRSGAGHALRWHRPQMACPQREATRSRPRWRLCLERVFPDLRQPRFPRG